MLRAKKSHKMEEKKWKSKTKKDKQQKRVKISIQKIKYDDERNNRKEQIIRKLV